MFKFNKTYSADAAGTARIIFIKTLTGKTIELQPTSLDAGSIKVALAAQVATWVKSLSFKKT